MKVQELFEATKKAKKPIPKMQFPGCKVSMLQSWRNRLEKTIKEMGYDKEMAGFEEGSTVWSVGFHIDKKFNIDEFEDQLRDKLQFDGWLKVRFFDLVEE